MRAATEFIAALGANVGAGMIFAGRRARSPEIFPGLGKRRLWNGRRRRTYAVGRAASVYFLKALPCKMPAAPFGGAATNEISRSRLFPPRALAFGPSWDCGDLLNKL